MQVDKASKEFDAVVAKSVELEEILRTTLSAASEFRQCMEKAKPIIHKAAGAVRNQQAILNRFNAIIRGAAVPMSRIRDSSRTASGLITEIGQTLVRMQD